MPGVLILLFAGVAVVLFVVGHHVEKKRQETFKAYAGSRSLLYSPHKDYRFDEQFRAFSHLRQGSNRYLRHRFQGQTEGQDLLMGEYHYQVTRSSGKSSQTHHYYATVVLLRVAFRLSDLSIREEGLFDKMKAAFGWDDIDFSSVAFSKRFHVSAPNRNDAFALIQPRTMDLLMSHRKFELHSREGWLMLHRRGSMRVEDLEELRQLALAFLEEVPGFVKEGESE